MPYAHIISAISTRPRTCGRGVGAELCATHAWLLLCIQYFAMLLLSVRACSMHHAGEELQPSTSERERSPASSSTLSTPLRVFLSPTEDPIASSERGLTRAEPPLPSRTGQGLRPRVCHPSKCRAEPQGPKS